MSDSTRIGAGICPVCSSPKARFTLTSKGLVCLTCNGCNFQGFARSERSDELLRGRIRAAPDVPVPEPGAPADSVRDLPPPAAANPPPTDAPPPRRSLMSW